MVDLSVEVREERGVFTVPERAASIKRAAEFVASSFPGSKVGASFPIDGDGFFTDDVSVEEFGTSPPVPFAG